MLCLWPWVGYLSQDSDWLRAKGWGDRIPLGRVSSRLSRPALGQSSFLKMVTGSFQLLKSGWGVSMPLHPHLVPWWRKSRAKLLHTQWAVEPVQSLSALQGCTLPFTYVCDQWQALWTWHWNWMFRNLYITCTIKTSPVAL